MLTSALGVGGEGVCPATGDVAGEERVLTLQRFQLAECPEEQALCEASEMSRGLL